MEECLSCGKLFDPKIEQKIYDELIEDVIDWDRSYGGVTYCAECEYNAQMETYFYDPYD